jgi:hypothetical protein
VRLGSGGPSSSARRATDDVGRMTPVPPYPEAQLAAKRLLRLLRARAGGTRRQTARNPAGRPGRTPPSVVSFDDVVEDVARSTRALAAEESPPERRPVFFKRRDL